MAFKTSSFLQKCSNDLSYTVHAHVQFWLLLWFRKLKIISNHILSIPNRCGFCQQNEHKFVDFHMEHLFSAPQLYNNKNIYKYISNGITIHLRLLSYNKTNYYFYLTNRYSTNPLFWKSLCLQIGPQKCEDKNLTSSHKNSSSLSHLLHLVEFLDCVQPPASKHNKRPLKVGWFITTFHIMWW